MSASEEIIYERTCAMTGRKIREPFTLFPDLPLTVYIDGDDPLLDIWPPGAVDQWNEKVRLNIASGGEIERRELAAIESVRAAALAAAPPPSFYDGDARLTKLPRDVIERVSAEAMETSENYRALNARLGEQIRSRLEQMVSDSLNRRKSGTT